MSSEPLPENPATNAPGDLPLTTQEMIGRALAGGVDGFLDGFTETGDGPQPPLTPEQIAQMEALEQQILANIRPVFPLAKED